MKKNVITRGTKDLIQQIIKETQTTDRYVLCEKVAIFVESRYPGKALDYQLKRMRLETTGQILDAIDSLLQKKSKY